MYGNIFINKGVVGMDKKEAIKKAKLYADTVIKEFNPRKIILFGSYATGNQREYSDIDIAIIVDEIKGNYLDDIVKLYRMRRKIDSRIEPHILEMGNDDSGMLHEVLTSGNVLYSAQ